MKDVMNSTRKTRRKCTRSIAVFYVNFPAFFSEKREKKHPPALQVTPADPDAPAPLREMPDVTKGSESLTTQQNGLFPLLQTALTILRYTAHDDDPQHQHAQGSGGGEERAGCAFARVPFLVLVFGMKTKQQSSGVQAGTGARGMMVKTTINTEGSLYRLNFDLGFALKGLV